jgi:2-enoate reductase
MLAGTRYPDVPPLYTPEGPLAELAGRIKKRVKVPVLAVAGIATPRVAEEILAQGKADMVGVGRAMFADPGWVSKVHAKKAGEITPCIRCNFCHRKIVIQRAGAVECTVNPGLQREPLKRAAKAKKVIVVGAGPAGLEAALTAAERGHHVTLYEKEKELGGNVRLGCIPPFKQDLARLLTHYERRLAASSVDFRPGQEATAERVRKEGAEVVIVAVGAGDFRPRIPGLTADAVVTARDFYRKKVLRGRSSQRAVVIGAGEVGCEIAWFLAGQGRPVSIVDVLPRKNWFSDQHPTNRFILMENLADLGVQLLDGAKNIRIAAARKGHAEKGHAAASGGGRSVSLDRDGVSYTISAPLIVLATGYLKDVRLGAALKKGKGGPAVYTVGDCADARDIHAAVHEGYAIGATI